MLKYKNKLENSSSTNLFFDIYMKWSKFIKAFTAYVLYNLCNYFVFKIINI